MNLLDAKVQLENLTENLLFLSESESNFTLTVVETANLVSEMKKIAHSEQEPTEWSLEKLFRNHNQIKDWHTETDKANVLRYQALEKFLTENFVPTVFRLGEIEVYYFIAILCEQNQTILLSVLSIET